MIKRLKRRFIALAMVSLALLLTAIVAGMNLINYNTVISEADSKLEALSANGGRLPFSDDYDGPEGSGMRYPDDDYEVDEDFWGEDSSLFGGWPYYDNIDSSTWDDLSGLGRRKPFISRDEAEETRFFSVLVTGEKSVLRANTDRIYAVDESSAADFAVKALENGSDKGFVDVYRYVISSEGSLTRITFLDCTSSLAAYRQFLYASIIMSLAGLLVTFAVICYFAGRIVRPVAESYEKQKRFITDAGHEIKTPLAIIKANLDVMEMDIEDLEAAQAVQAEAAEENASDPPAMAQISGDMNESSASLKESLMDIGNQVERLATLTNDLVYLSRMEEADNSLAMTEIPVSDIVSETADSFDALALERGKELDISVTPMLSMQGSTKEIEKLVSILVENALKYSAEGDRISVSLSREGKNIQLEVRNKASEPLSDEDLAHVFERFYRADKSRHSEAGGHGIGLSMAHAIVNAHGGKIRARSGDGSEFIVTATFPAV